MRLRRLAERRRRLIGVALLMLAASGVPGDAMAQEVGSRVRACGQVTMVNCDNAGAVSWILDVGAPDVLLVTAKGVPERAGVIEIARYQGFGRLCVSGRLVRKNAPFELAEIAVDTLREIKPDGEPGPDPLGPDVSRTCDPGVRLPIVLKERRPNYPSSAVSLGIEGAVWVEAVVDAHGKISKTRVIRSRDRRTGLDDEALAAARKWQFEPATKDGKPVAMAVTIELTFTIKKKPLGDHSR
jgi:TonB family protein